MGEVYRARDTKLNRDVALKVLPETVAADPERLARFRREAQLLAALNHPNIAAIYGFEDSGATHALVMELVEGSTLADRTAQGPLPFAEALPIARQIADALEAAHEQGIIHRDLKPANIKVRADGAVKVLDFGLAKLTDPAGSAQSTVGGQQVSLSPTITSPAMLTGLGMIVGTPAYMSPEQAKGRPADKRSDIWAFGCVLYELLTGTTAFPGESISEVISEILKSEPSWSRLPASTPPAVQRLLHRCLEKDPRLRLRDIGDARLDLDEAQRRAAEPDVRGAASSRSWLLIGAVVALAAFAAAATYVATVSRQGAAVNRPLERFQLPVPPGTDAVAHLAFSPAGTEVAMIAAMPRGYGIFVRSLASLETRQVVALQGATSLFWSPDSRSLGFFDGGQLKILNVATGDVRILCEAPSPFGGTWGADDTILFAPRAAGGLYSVNAGGGAVTQVTAPDPAAGAESHRWPQFLPDGRRFVFVAWSAARTAGSEKYVIDMSELGSQAITEITRASSAAIYDPAGYLLFGLDAPKRLVAVRFDPERGAVSGDRITIADDLDSDWLNAALPATTRGDGTLFYRTNRHEARTITWFERSGRETGTVGEPAVYFDPALSPDGQSLIVERADPNTVAGDLWKVDLAVGTLSPLTREPTFENVAVWSPDGQRYVYSSDRDGVSHLYVARVDGSGVSAKIGGGPNQLAYASDWRHGVLLFTMLDARRNEDVWMLPDGGEAKPLLQGPYVERGATLSPDGRWTAYESTESGESQVYVASFPGLTGKRQVSSRGGAQPMWRADGRELFFAGPDGSVNAVSISTTGTVAESGVPAMLFNPDLDIRNGLRNWFVATADGQRFLVLKPSAERRSGAITAVFNWPALVPRRD